MTSYTATDSQTSLITKRPAIQKIRAYHRFAFLCMAGLFYLLPVDILRHIYVLLYCCLTSHFHFSGKDFFIIFIIFPKQIRRIQFIRTFAFTLSAVKTILDLFHILLPLFVQPVCRRRSSYHQRHSRTVVDLDPCRTRHTISASPAKISGQFRLFFLDKCFDLFIVNRATLSYIQAILPVLPSSGFPRSEVHCQTATYMQMLLWNC